METNAKDVMMDSTRPKKANVFQVSKKSFFGKVDKVVIYVYF